MGNNQIFISKRRKALHFLISATTNEFADYLRNKLYLNLLRHVVGGSLNDPFCGMKQACPLFLI